MINNFEAPAIAIESANRTIRPVKGMSGYGSGVSTVSSMILPFNSARRKQISDALNTGRLNTGLANALVKENSNAILNGLMNSDFTQYEMYVTDEENPDDHTTVRHSVDNSNEKLIFKIYYVLLLLVESLTQKLKFLLVCKVIKLVMLLLFQLK